MNLIRTATWVVLLGAAAFAGPNLPAQGLAVLREAVGAIANRVCSGPFIKTS